MERSLLVVLALLVLAGPGWGDPPKNKPVKADLVVVNASNPGQKIDIKPYIVKGKYTVIDFYSEYCPPCRFLGRVLALIASRKGDLALRKIDINRPSTRGIDWWSPASVQYDLQARAIPYMQVYDPRGKMVADGTKATMKFMQKWAKETGTTEEEVDKIAAQELQPKNQKPDQ